MNSRRKANRSPERVGIATMNAKHIGMGNDAGRMLAMIEGHRNRGVGIVISQESNDEGYEAIRDAEGLGAYRPPSNGGKGWTGNLITWDEAAGYQLSKAWFTSRRYLYVPKRRPWKAHRVDNYVPMVRLRTPGGRLINVRGDHVPTERNSKAQVRLRAWNGGRAWLIARRGPSFLGMDANRRHALKTGRKVQLLADHGVDQIYGNGRMRVVREGDAPHRSKGLSDHDSPWAVVELPPRRRRRPRRLTPRALLTTTLRSALTPKENR